MSNEEHYKSLNINIREGGGFYDLEEVVHELKDYNDVFDTHSMNEGILFKQGQKDMLEQIIKYLEKCL